MGKKLRLIISTGASSVVSAQTSCYQLQNCHWTFLNKMEERRRFSSTVSLPRLGLVVIGGESDSRTRHSTMSALRSPAHGWKEILDFAAKVSRHCSVSFSSSAIFVIGGFVEDQPFSDKVMKINLETLNAFTLTSRMKTGRQLHSCAVVDSNKIIVVGGRNYRGLVSSVEVFNVMTSTWSSPKHLEFAQAPGYGQLVSVHGEIKTIIGIGQF